MTANYSEAEQIKLLKIFGVSERTTILTDRSENVLPPVLYFTVRHQQQIFISISCRISSAS